jgi:hypothetical protein
MIKNKMETDMNNNKLKNNKSSPQQKAQKSQKKEKRSPNKYIKFIKTNLYLNEYNYYFKNAIKMNKLREQKIKELKQNSEMARKNNILPKMLYCNKYLNNDIKKNYPNKKIDNINNNKNTITKAYTTNSINLTECISSENRPYAYRKIEKAIIAKNIEEHNKSHIKKTIKAFDDLIKYIDNFKFQNRTPNLKVLINQNNDNNKSDVIDDKENDDNIAADEDIIKVENYNYDEFKENYKKDKLSKNSNSQINLKTFNNQRILETNPSDDFRIINNIQNNNNDNIYLTAANHLIKNKKIKGNLSKNDIKQKELSNSFDNTNKNNKSKDKNKLIINNMTLISDDTLISKIKKVGRDFKKGLYFDEYGKFKFTELGLNYPNSVDKYKKIPDYQGTDLEEKKVFKYKSVITNPKYNYTNIGSFNEKFNHDLSDISTYYGKENSKGRFIRNPLVSKYSKYIPNYEKYKDLKFIENRYISKNKYKFRLKPLINSRKNNFDKLANNVYKKEHKNDFFK